MAHLTISVPEEHVDELRRELLHAHAERAAELRRALDRYLDSHRCLDTVRGALVELEDLDAAVAQLGWAPAAVPRAVSLTAHPELLADALQAMRGGEEAGTATLAALLRTVERGE